MSGTISAASSWKDGAAWPTGGNPTRLGNTKGGVAKVENDYTMTTQNKMTDFFVQDGDFEITATKTIYYNSFYLINGNNSDFAAGTRASVLKKSGDWQCIGYEFIIGHKSGVTVAFTNQTGNCTDIGKSRTAADRIPFQVAGWGSSTKTAPASPYSNIDAEFVVNGGSVTVAGYGNAGIACASDSNGRVIINGGSMSAPFNFVGWGTRSTGSITVNDGTYTSSSEVQVGYGENSVGKVVVNGGTFTALGQLAYNGGTTVEIGTTLVIPDTSLGGGLAASLPATQLSAGTTNILVRTTGEGVFTDSDLPDVSALPYYRAVLSEDAKSILVVRVAPLMTVTGFNLETGAITLDFESIDAPLSLVVAWDTTDHGASLGSWPTGQSVILTNEVAAGTTTGTYTLPEEIFVVGMYYRLFLGDNATMPYDAEVAWIQPASSGAYMKTLYTPVKSSRAEFKFNMDNQTYDSGYKTIVGVSDGWPRGLRVSVNNDGWMQNVRVGTMRFAELGKAGFSNTVDHVVKLNFGQTTTCFTIDDKNNGSIYHEYTDDNKNTVTSNYDTYNNNSYAAPNNPLTIWANDGGGNPTMVKIYYLKWMNASGTVTRDYIPVVKDGEYCLYDKKTETLLHNAGAEGTSFTGGADTGNHPPVSFADGQMTASDTQQYLGATVLDQENCSITMAGATATINWALTQPGGTSAEIVAVFQTGSTAITNVIATGKVADPSEWDARIQLPIDNPETIAADVTGGTFEIENPIPNGYKTMRFVIATSGSTESNLVPLLFSKPYKTLRAGTTLYLR